MDGVSELPYANVERVEQDDQETLTSWESSLSDTGSESMVDNRMPVFRMFVVPLSSVGTLCTLMSLLAVATDSPDLAKEVAWSSATVELDDATDLTFNIFSGLDALFEEIVNGTDITTKSVGWADADCPDEAACADCASSSFGLTTAAMAGAVFMLLALVHDARRSGPVDSAASKFRGVVAGATGIACIVYALLAFARDCHVQSIHGVAVAPELARGWYLAAFAVVARALVVLVHLLTPVAAPAYTKARKFTAYQQRDPAPYAPPQPQQQQQYYPVHPSARRDVRMHAGAEEIRTRIGSVTNTKKITEAMRLVAAAKVRRAQAAVLGGRPFNESLAIVFNQVVKSIDPNDQASIPVLAQRDVVKKVLLVCMTGDRGLCGGYNNYAIKKAVTRAGELQEQGVELDIYTVGKKGSQFFLRRKDMYNIVGDQPMGQKPGSEEATEVADFAINGFLAGDYDAVEIVYTNFKSLINSAPSLRTIVPFQPTMVSNEEDDELCLLTTKQGQLDCEPEEARKLDVSDKKLEFDQSGPEVLNSLLPLYINGQVLRMMQESVASELAARMTAMQTASDNASDLKKDLSQQYNRMRQAAVTSQIIEISSGAAAANS